MGLFDGVGNYIEDLTGLNTGSGSSMDNALAAQQGASHEANELQRYMYNTTREDNQPWRDAGVKALGQMQDPSFQHSFTMADFQADPSYQFRMQEGQKAIARASAAKGLFSTGSLKSLSDYNQNAASQEYQNAFNRFQTDQTNRYNRLASLSGNGQTANAANQQAGQAYANQTGENLMGSANAQAASTMAQANQRNALYGQFMQNAATGMGMGGGGGMRFSDKRLKENIERISDEDMQELKSTLKPYKFNYKNEEHGGGDWIGVMAQDLEKSKLGRSLVSETPEGFKQVDMNKVLSLFLATLAAG